MSGFSFETRYQPKVDYRAPYGQQQAAIQTGSWGGVWMALEPFTAVLHLSYTAQNIVECYWGHKTVIGGSRTCSQNLVSLLL